MKVIVALLSGLLFGVGLSLGGMTQPAVVLGFLDIFGQWDPRLLFVMAGAVPITALGYHLGEDEADRLGAARALLRLPKDQIYRCSDGRHLQSHGAYPHFAVALCRALGRPEWSAEAAAGVDGVADAETRDRWRDRFATELAKAQGMRPQSMATIVAALQSLGLVAGAPDPRDGRKTVLRLTEKAREEFRTGRLAKEDWLTSALVATLTPEQIAQVAEVVPLLRRLGQA